MSLKNELGFEDVNGDGVIDEADVLLIYQGGVAVDGKGDDDEQ